ncbi:MAG: dihydrofolate reductase [Alphaproteobacteria bacterium]
MRLSLIAAVARNGVIGADGGLPWRIPADLRRFRALTMGKPVVMGRKTYVSIGRALPGRANIVLTRDPAFRADGVETAADLDTALTLARRRAAEAGADEVFIIGGAEIYAAALPFADRLYLTEVDADIAGDAHFPAYARDGWRDVAAPESFPAEAGAPPARLVVLERRARPIP